MARLPLYEQQTSVGAVRADPNAFGAGVAQAQGQMGGVLEDIGFQMKRRADVIDRIQLMSDFDRFAQDSLTALNDTEDISRPETTAKYEAALQQKANEILQRHGGMGASRAELQAQITNQRAQYAKSAVAAQVKAQQVQIANIVEQTSNELAISAAFAPDKMTDVFTELDKRLEVLGDAISPTLAAEYRNAGRAKIATNAVTQVLQRGDWQAAKAMMQNPEVGKYLGPDAARRFTIEIAVDEGKQAAEIQRQNRNVMSWTQRLGRNLSPEETMRIRALPEKKDMTVADQIVEYELITGKPAPQSVVDQFYKVDGPGGGASGLFGNSLQGRALSFVTENAVAYANGMLPPEQARIYEASLAEAYKPVMRPNPVTGQIEEIRPTIPNFVTQASEQGSRFYGGGALATRSSAGPSGLVPGQRVQLDIGGQTIGQATVGPDGTWTIPAPPEQRVPTGGAAGGPQPSPQGEPTIWEMADSIAGPGPAAAAAAEQLPVVGETLGPAAGQILGVNENVTKNRQYIRTQISQMVDALSINPRNPVALVEMIRKEIDVDPKVMDNPAAYRKRIEGVNRALTERLIEETAAGNDPSLPAKTRQDALTVADTIRKFQQKLMPPMVKNRAELDALGLPPGAKFVDPEGKLRQVPQR